MSSPWIQTYMGIHFDLLDPQPEMIDIGDIAHALARIFRFTGHGNEYSVAQHSILVSYRVPLELAFQGLMHDAHEAYMGDISAPLKRVLPDVQEYEKFLAGVVRVHFGLPEELDPEVQETDLKMLLIEKRYNFADDLDWGLGELPSHLREDCVVENCFSPSVAEREFLARFWQLRRRHGH